MRIEIMIDKEQKISQSTLDALETELYRNLRLCTPKQQFVFARAAPTASS
ncbi:prophage protein [Salmonella enterica subsp. enterica serovar Montevideo]|nr:prophage protein [Salmonella enterica subsp. enterica serovar Montevideo]